MPQRHLDPGRFLSNRANQLTRMRRPLLLGCIGCLSGLHSLAQSRSPTPEPVVTQYLELRGGYTGGQFEHYTADYKNSIDLFGPSKPRPGQLVEHRFAGALVGVDFGREMLRPDIRRKITVLAGLDVLAASDQLTFADGHRASLPLGAVHPHFGLGLERGNLLLRADAGLLAGRVGYYEVTTSEGFLSNSTVVDTVKLVPTITFRAGWANWMLFESGYGTSGLLGLANPVWHAGLGTGFGRRSPVAVLFGITGAESTDYGNSSSDYYYLQLGATPAASRWRASGLVTLGAGSYSRIAAQVAYRLPLRTGATAVAQ